MPTKRATAQAWVIYTIAKRVTKLKGQKRTEEQRERMSEAHRARGTTYAAREASRINGKKLAEWNAKRRAQSAVTSSLDVSSGPPSR